MNIIIHSHTKYGNCCSWFLFFLFYLCVCVSDPKFHHWGWNVAVVSSSLWSIRGTFQWLTCLLYLSTHFNSWRGYIFICYMLKRILALVQLETFSLCFYVYLNLCFICCYALLHRDFDACELHDPFLLQKKPSFLGSLKSQIYRPVWFS